MNCARPQRQHTAPKSLLCFIYLLLSLSGQIQAGVIASFNWELTGVISESYAINPLDNLPFQSGDKLTFSLGFDITELTLNSCISCTNTDSPTWHGHVTEFSVSSDYGTITVDPESTVLNKVELHPENSVDGWNWARITVGAPFSYIPDLADGTYGSDSYEIYFSFDLSELPGSFFPNTNDTWLLPNLPEPDSDVVNEFVFGISEVPYTDLFISKANLYDLDPLSLQGTASVPEPSSIGLLSLGLGVALFLRRRK